MDKARAGEVMRTHGWLSRRPEPFRMEVLKRCHLRRIGAGEALFDAGDRSAGVFGLVEGNIGVELPNGQVATIKSPGYWMGEGTGFRPGSRMATMIASEASHVLFLPLAEFERLIANAEYCRYFAILTLEHLEEAISVIGDLMATDPMARVAGRLLTLIRAQPDGRATFPITQGELASMCGLTRQTVNKVVRRLTADGVVASKYGHLTVLDATKLHSRARRVWQTAS